MNQDNQVQEVSIKRMLFFVGSQWKRILAVAAALAVLLGGIQGYRAWDATNRMNQQAALEDREDEKTKLEQRAASIQREIDHQREYLEESILMQLDYYDIHEAKVSLYISTDYQIMPDMEYQNTDERGTILNVYHVACTCDKVLEEVARQMGIETKYLKELVTVTTSNNRILSIYVWQTNSADAERIRDLILAQMDGVGEEITNTIGEHTMSVVNDSVGVVVDTSVADLQEEARGRLTEAETSLAQVQSELKAVTKSADTGTSAGTAAVKDSFVWAVIGGIVGVFLGTVAACWGFIFGDKVTSGEEIKCRFGIKLIGGVWSGRKKCDPITAALMTAEGRVSRNSDDNLELIAPNISNYSGGAVSILLAGAENGELADLLQPRLGKVKLIPCGSLVTSAAALRLLPGCDGVLLVEKRGISRYSAAAREMERVRDAGKHLIGCIIEER